MMKHVNYDQISGVYDQRYRAGGPTGIAECLCELARQTEGHRVLEVGCGTGHWLTLLPNGGIRCGLDYSTRMLDKARQRDDSLRLVRGTADRLPFGQGAFDFVFCVHALHHFDDPATFIRQARRVIRAGGALAIMGMDPQREPDEWYLYDYFPGTREADRGRYPSGDVILHWMEMAGFVRCERRLAARIEHDSIGSEVLNDPILQKNGTSQLALLTEEAFERGMARIREALRLAESSGEKIVFRTRIALPAVIGFVPDTGESRPSGVWIYHCAGGCSPRRTGSRSQVIFMIKSPVQAAIFDFDYTLADSSRGVVECINFALDSLNLPTVSAERACQTIGLSLVDTFVHLAGEVTTAQSDEFARLFIKRADEVMADLTILFESVPQTIAVLKEQGLGLGIVSTKFRYRIESILKREGLLDAFDVIIGGEDVPNHKPDPEGLRLAVGKLGRSPLDCVYVGDSVVDAETAKRAGVPFIAVLSGVTPREAFGAYDVRQVLEHVCDLPGWLGH
jgi:phosphoglycolate phosphatase